jgi:hypothetical protein
VAGHCGEAGVDLSGLALADLVDCGSHVIEDPALRHTAQHAECLRQRIKQHLMRLKRIGGVTSRLEIRLEFGL